MLKVGRGEGVRARKDFKHNDKKHCSALLLGAKPGRVDEADKAILK